MEAINAADLLQSAQAAKAEYDRTVDLATLKRAISDYEALLTELTPHHSDYPSHACALSELYVLLGRYTADAAHNQQALDTAINARDATSPTDVARVDCLHSVAYAYLNMHDSDSRHEIVIAALKNLDEALQLAGKQHPKLARILSMRARSLALLAEFSVGDQQLGNASEFLKVHESALVHAVTDDDRAFTLHWYAQDISKLEIRLPQDVSRLDEAISMEEASIHILTERKSHLRLPDVLNGLASCHYVRWKSRSSAPVSDARLAHEYVAAAADLLPPDHYWGRFLRLNEAEVKLDIYETYGFLEDLESGLNILRNQVETLPRTYWFFYGPAMDFGRALLMAFRNRGVSSLLDESVEWHGLAVQYAPRPHVWKSRLELGRVLFQQYLHQGETGSLESAIETLEQARREALFPHESGQVLVDLCRALTARNLAQGGSNDLDTALEYIERVIRVGQPNKNRDLPAAYDAHGQAILARFRQTHSVQTLFTAAKSFEVAIALAEASQRPAAEYYCRLGRVRRLTFEMTGCAHDLEDSIEALRRSTTLTEQANPLSASHRFELALSLVARFEVGHSPADFAESSDLLESAYSHEQSYFRDRWIAAKERARLLHVDQPRAALESYETAISLLPRVAWLGLEEQVRYETAQSWLAIGNNAAACAIGQSKPELAVELLENSRSVLWNQQLQLGQANDFAPGAIDSELLSELKSVGRALEASFADSALEECSFGESENATRLEQASRARRRLAERWEELAAEVRSRPGAENFLCRSRYSDLRQAAVSGPLVVLNISEYRSDGIVITTDRPACPFPLPNASPDVISLHARHLITALYHSKDWRGIAFAEGQVSQILQTLWTAVGEHVCSALQPFLPEGELSRVWLLPTGALAALPIHAAVSGGPEPIGLMDVMIPSYTSTLSALSRAQARLNEGKHARMLAIGCSRTRDENALPSWLEEKDILMESFREEDLTILEDEKATSEQVLVHLPRHNFVHLTSHGHHDWLNPYRSHLALHDGPLTLRRLAQQKLEHADFAFLSACHTARIDPRAPDESVNLASGLNLAGFRSIIGTLWSIADCDAGVAAESVYSHLTRDGRTPDPSQAAEALHAAVQRMRYRGLPVIRWAPFIHIGI